MHNPELWDTCIGDWKTKRVSKNTVVQIKYLWSASGEKHLFTDGLLHSCNFPGILKPAREPIEGAFLSKA